MRVQNGYGFVHYAFDAEGIQAALTAVQCLHQVTMDGVSYDCSISHTLQRLIQAQDPRYGQAAANRVQQGAGSYSLSLYSGQSRYSGLGEEHRLQGGLPGSMLQTWTQQRLIGQLSRSYDAAPGAFESAAHGLFRPRPPEHRGLDHHQRRGDHAASALHMSALGHGASSLTRLFDLPLDSPFPSPHANKSPAFTAAVTSIHALNAPVSTNISPPSSDSSQGSVSGPSSSLDWLLQSSRLQSMDSNSATSSSQDAVTPKEREAEDDTHSLLAALRDIIHTQDF
jgi:hypothetical protein